MLLLGPGSWIYLGGESTRPGTLGLIVEDANGEFDGLLGLGAAHTVGALCPRFAAVREVWAPPPRFRCGGTLDVPVGVTVRSAPDAATPRVVTDAAVFEIHESVDVEQRVVWRRSPLTFSGIREIEPMGESFRVHKLGARTGLTTGYLDPAPRFAALTDHTRAIDYELGYAVVGDGSAFADSGDSGSAVYDDDGAVVGLVAGMLGSFTSYTGALGTEGDTPALVLPITDIFVELSVRMP